MTYKQEWVAAVAKEIARLRKLLKLVPVLLLAVLPLIAQSNNVLTIHLGTTNCSAVSGYAPGATGGCYFTVQEGGTVYEYAGGEATWFDERDPASIEEIRPAICQGCVELHLIGWNEGEWHHNVKSRGGKRCDCAACGLFVCKTTHEIHR